MLAKVARTLARQVPECRNRAYAAQALSLLTLGTPFVGVFSRLLQPAALWLPGGLIIPEATLGLLTVCLGSLIAAKLAVKNNWPIAQPRKRVKKREIGRAHV